MANVIEYATCDFCDSDDTELLYGCDDWGKMYGVDFTLVRCKICGLMYLNPRPRQDVITSFYPEEYAPFRIAIEQETSVMMKWMRRHKLVKRRRIVEKFSGFETGSILDVGCATGLFLNEMQRAGWQAMGVEIVESAANYARQQFGLDIFLGFLDDVPFQRASFDVITFWDVLEHTFSPKKTLRKTNELLKPGGIVAINIPNWDSPDRVWFGPYWIGLDPPRHLFVFTRKTLENMLEDAGFQVINWECFFPSYFSFAISLERTLAAKGSRWLKPIARFLKFPGVRFLFEPYFTLANQMKRGGVISLFARKLS